MSEWPRGLHSLLLQRDGCRLRLADPNGQVTIPRGLAQQQHRLVLGLFHADSHDSNFAHRASNTSTSVVPRV
ncbi:Uncharacterised protein [Mycobacteroides abscessus subsp. abscessus]|nr:Uncharacterised protein [Mycobacteroides abscessus subsp. abscessus]